MQYCSGESVRPMPAAAPSAFTSAGRLRCLATSTRVFATKHGVCVVMPRHVTAFTTTTTESLICEIDSLAPLDSAKNQDFLTQLLLLTILKLRPASSHHGPRPIELIMTIKDSYTLRDFEAYAHKEFPAEFSLIANPTLYNLVQNRFTTGDGILKEVEMVHVAYWNVRKDDTPVWTWLDGNDVLYFSGKVGEMMSSRPSPFPIEGCTRITAYQGPFFSVLERDFPTRGRLRKRARTLARTQLSFLTRFAYLLNGKVTAISNPDKEDFFLTLQDVCMQIQRNRVVEEKEREDLLRQIGFQGPSSVRLPVVLAGVERAGEQSQKAIDSSASESEQHDHIEQDSRNTLSAASTEGTLRLSNSRKRPRVDASNESPGTTNHQSEQKQVIFESLIQQCKAELKAEFDQEKNALQAEIVQLRSELDEQKQVAEASAEEMRKSHRDVEASAEEWKKKYEKLFQKVQIFREDD